MVAFWLDVFLNNYDSATTTNIDVIIGQCLLPATGTTTAGHTDYGDLISTRKMSRSSSSSVAATLALPTAAETQ